MGISIPEITNALDCQQNESMEHPLHNQPVKVNHISCCMWIKSQSCCHSSLCAYKWDLLHHQAAVLRSVNHKCYQCSAQIHRIYILILYFYYTLSFGKIVIVFEISLLCPSRVHLFDQNNINNSNIMRYYYNLKVM